MRWGRRCILSVFGSALVACSTEPQNSAGPTTAGGDATVVDAPEGDRSAPPVADASDGNPADSAPSDAITDTESDAAGSAPDANGGSDSSRDAVADTAGADVSLDGSSDASADATAGGATDAGVDGAVDAMADAAADSSSGLPSVWPARLAAAKTDATTAAGTPYFSSTRLLVSWSPVAPLIDHYVISARDSVTAGTVTVVAAGAAFSTTLTGLKSSTEYTVSISACADAACTQLASGDGTALASTEQEYWQLQGSPSTDSFTAMTTIVRDSNTKGYALRYGPGAPSALEGTIRLYYDGMNSKGVNIGTTPTAATASPASANTFTALSPAYGLFQPPTGIPYIGPAGPSSINTSQAVPLPAAMGSKMRLFLEAAGTDSKSRILSIDSADGYIGQDFNRGTATSCTTAADYSAGGGCAATLVVGVTGDGAADSGLLNARQFKVGYPQLGSWVWDGAAGTFMAITAERSCAQPRSGLAYAVFDGASWVVDKDAGCPRYVVDNAHGPVVVHLGESRYKLYYEDTSAGMTSTPLRVIYADGSRTGAASTVEFADWEASAKAREVNFLWPSGRKLTDANEAGLGDHVIVLPTADPKVQFMYANLGGFDDPSWNKPPAGIGMAVLVNP